MEELIRINLATQLILEELPSNYISLCCSVWFCSLCWFFALLIGYKQLVCSKIFLPFFYMKLFIKLFNYAQLCQFVVCCCLFEKYLGGVQY